MRGDVRIGVVFENAYALAQNSPFSVLNCPFDFYQCFTVPFSVYYAPSKHKASFHSKNKLSTTFDGKLCLFEFSRPGWRRMPPFILLLFGLKYTVECPDFITRDDWVQEVALFVYIVTKKFAKTINSLPFVAFHQQWYRERPERSIDLHACFRQPLLVVNFITTLYTTFERFLEPFSAFHSL